jgi:ketosteroid isomerase-like protein
LTGPGQSAERDEAVVTAWFGAFNLRDLDGMLERFVDEIEFRPLRFPGVEPYYVGHAGIREWFAAVTGGGHVHRIEAESFSRTEDGRLLVAGKVSLASVGGIAPFSGLYEFEGGRIRKAIHYFTPVAVLDRLGLVEDAT